MFLVLLPGHFLPSDNTHTQTNKNTHRETHRDTCSSTAVHNKLHHLIAPCSYAAIYATKVSLELVKCSVETQFKNKIKNKKPGGLANFLRIGGLETHV